MKTKKMVRFQLSVILVLVMFINGSSITAYGYYDTPPSKNLGEQQFENVDYQRFYYNQLNDIEKAIYQNLVKAKEQFLNKEEIVFAIHPYNETQKLGLVYYTNIVRRARKAYVYDNPETEIWFDVYERDFFRDQNYTYMKLTPKVKSNGTINSESIKKQVAKFEQEATNFVNTLSGTEREKLKQIHDWLIKKAVYDYTLKHQNTRTAYGTIIEGTSICSGFAYAFKYLSDLAGLKALYVTGKVYKSSSKTYVSHAWNIVYVDGEYLLIDVTLDNPSNRKPIYTFWLTPINDKIHYVDNYYFNYPFK